MLIITRRVGESIRIITESGAATIVITDVANGNVRLGVDAPKFMRVERDDMKSRPILDTASHVDEREVARKIKDTSSHPCTKCGQPSWTLNGLCFKCDQAEQRD